MGQFEKTQIITTYSKYYLLQTEQGEVIGNTGRAPVQQNTHFSQNIQIYFFNLPK